MTILGIETSCDETSAAVIQEEDNKIHLLSNTIATSLNLHAKTGGIIPEIAAREQVAYMIPVLEEAVEKGLNCKFKEKDKILSSLDAIAVTYGPGLIGSLLVGVETAKTLSLVWNKPIVPVNHMIGHIYANWIENSDILLPAVVLVVSGGHTDLLLLKKHGLLQLLGGTRDDAAGECFDKCARLLGYNYPGGPKIAELAQSGDLNSFPFPRPMISIHGYEFSFSGLKTAFLNTTQELFPILRKNTSSEKIGWQQAALTDSLSNSGKKTIANLCASLQNAIIEVLVKKTIHAAQKYQVKSILLSGGVAANQLLRDTFSQESKKQNFRFFVPSKKLCTDNAAMVASAAYFNFHPVDWAEVTTDPELYF